MLDSIGQADLSVRLHELSLRGKWDETTSLIAADVLHEIAIVGEYDRMPDLIYERFGGRVDRISMQLLPDEACSPVWAEIIAEVKRRTEATRSPVVSLTTAAD